MRICIDINHPAHVHYFKNFIKIMERKGHEFVVINRDQKIINDLLDANDIKHIIRNRRPEEGTFYNSMVYLLSLIYLVFKNSKNRRIDIYVGFASFPCALVSFLLRKPSIIIDDTEHNNMNHALYKPFCSAILTPFYFSKKLGKKQQYFNAFVEQFYLHSHYFTEDRHQNLDLPTSYALIRFSSYSAQHDKEVKTNLSVEERKQLIEIIAKKIKVFVSFEGLNADPFFDPFLLKIKAEDMHHVIKNASIIVTEGATMASEAGILGTSYYYINPLKVGNVAYQCSRYANAHQISPRELLNNLAKPIFLDKLLLNLPYAGEIYKQIEKETIDPTEFLVNFVETFYNAYKFS